MKKLFFAILAIALLSSCRQEDETMNNEVMPQLKKTENASFKKVGDSVGPVVVIPPKITGSTSETTITSTEPAQTTAAPASSAP